MQNCGDLQASAVCRRASPWKVRVHKCTRTAVPTGLGGMAGAFVHVQWAEWHCFLRGRRRLLHAFSQSSHPLHTAALLLHMPILPLCADPHTLCTANPQHRPVSLSLSLPLSLSLFLSLHRPPPSLHALWRPLHRPSHPLHRPVATNTRSKWP